jgi:tetratricopeptide (TPR) repeat protein
MGWEEMAAAMPVAERAALAAIRADSEDPWAHYALGSVYLFNRRFDDSIAEYDLALRLNPNFALARAYYGRALAFCGLWEEGDREARHALRLSPRDPFAARYCGVAAYARFIGRDYDEAIRLSRDALRQRHDLVGAHRVLTAAAGMSGLTDVAAAALQELRRAQPNITLAWIATQILSNARSIANTIWKALDARAWNSRAGLIFQLARSVSEVLILTPAFNSRRDIAEPPAVSPTCALFLRRRNTRRWRRFALVIGPAEAVSLSLLAPRLRFCTR